MVMELALRALDVLVALIVVFSVNPILHYIFKRRIKIQVVKEWYE